MVGMDDYREIAVIHNKYGPLGSSLRDFCPGFPHEKLRPPGRETDFKLPPIGSRLLRSGRPEGLMVTASVGGTAMQAGELSQRKGQTVSFVIPVFNEEGALGPLHAALAKVVDGLGADTEVIFIDDGSSDQSPKILDALAAVNSHVTVVHLRRNYGKAAALDAGFRHARSDVVITLDADLQDDPSEVPRFLDKLEDGYDMVSGWKRIRHDPIDKTLPSAIFNWFVRGVSGLKIHDFNSGFKAYRADCLKDLRIYGELHRYIPALLHWDGFRVCEIEITHHPRTTGQSKFGVGQFLTGAFNLVPWFLLLSSAAGHCISLAMWPSCSA